ncbi:hypothetical protein, partial [Burkholderia latens]|uniref:hypothetical protein n=1 Tax=Burkholderia latens TaxID=488446 RepID=UPI001C2DF841
ASRAAAATAARAATASAAAARAAAIRRRKHARAALAAQPIRKTGAFAPVFFRPAPHFTIRKIFLCRKKACCVAQPRRLRDGKVRFSLRNDKINRLIMND